MTITTNGGTRVHDMPFGPRIADDGRTTFRLWAPRARAPRLAVDGRDPVPMDASGGGWFEATVPAGPGTRYRFLLDDGTAVPDPASRSQPEGPHGPSELVDPAAYRWRHGEWPGRPFVESVFYELHVGTFTPEGTFAAAAGRLPYLADLGVTAVELMPVATFAGQHGWGYDGVLPYAPHPAYGRPDDLKAFVDAAHGHGLQVFLDVVYNHFGPDGNYLPLYAPVFTDRHSSPWGQGINVDDEGGEWVRRFLIENAVYWIDEYMIDGLRLDAVHAIRDDGPLHVLSELARRVRSATRGREVHLVLENADNDADFLDDGSRDPELYDAQWNDDLHHAMHVAVTGEGGGYYADFAADETLLATSLASGFGRHGQERPAGGRHPGKPSGHLPPTAFVSFLQNHDHVGNRALGERIDRTAGDPAKLRAAAAVLLLAPQIPLLFMGEEWAATAPFPFFCDFTGDLAEAVRKGRREEFAHFPEFSDPRVLEGMPDPVSRPTFLSAKLDWSEPLRPGHREVLAHVRELLAVRRKEIVPLAARIANGGEAERLGDGALAVR